MHQENENADAYQENDFTHLHLQKSNHNIHQNQPPCFQQIHVPLTKQQEETMLFGIHVVSNQPPNENLLDLEIDSPQDLFKNVVRPREFVDNRQVQITGPITIQDGYITSYKLYKIKTYKKSGGQQQSLVERRYSDFEYLHAQLIDKYGGFLIPKLPQKNMWATLNMETNNYIRFRKQKLKKYLEKLLNHRKLKYTDEVQSFLFEGQEFSQRKGEFSAQHKIEDTVIKLTSNALETGLDMLKKYISKQPEANSMKPINIKSLKQQQITQFEIIVDSMTNTMKQLKLIVFNTSQQSNILIDFGNLCDEMLDEEGDGRSIRILEYSGNVRIQKIDRGSMASDFTREGTGSQQISSEMEYQCEHLIESYENVFEFIEMCKSALNRRNLLYNQLQSFKQQYLSQQQKFKLNPRSINMDILKSRMSQTQVKLQKFTEDLLIELDMQVSMSKSMISQFIKDLKETRHGLYSKCI